MERHLCLARCCKSRHEHDACWNRVIRGKKQDQVSVACLLNVETMIPRDHPIRAIKGILGVVLREMRALRGDVRRGRKALHPAGAAASGEGADGALHDPFGIDNLIDGNFGSEKKPVLQQPASWAAPPPAGPFPILAAPGHRPG